MADKVLKGRQTRGQANGGAKLSEANAIKIMTAEATPAAALANKFGVSQSLIYAIRAGKVWSHLMKL